MINLAGRADSEHCKNVDEAITYELTTAGVTLVHGRRAAGEVPASITGKLGQFLFERAWYYWMVRGPMPLKYAIDMYNDSRGRKSVRVEGHCGCPSPLTMTADHKRYLYVSWMDSLGHKVKSRVEWEKQMKDYDICVRDVMRNAYSDQRITWVETREDVWETGTPCVESYHIDTQEGLNLFANMARIATEEAYVRDRREMRSAHGITGTLEARPDGSVVLSDEDGNLYTIPDKSRVKVQVCSDRACIYNAPGRDMLSIELPKRAPERVSDNAPALLSRLERGEDDCPEITMALVAMYRLYGDAALDGAIELAEVLDRR